MNWKHFGKVHKALYKLSGGRWGARMGWIDVALVEMTGRKTGKRRTVPIACYPHRDSVVVSASNSGKESHPAWFLNMQDHPHVTVQLGKQRFDADAVEVPDDEREALWEKIIEINKHQGEYLAHTERRIPLIWLRRRE